MWKSCAKQVYFYSTKCVQRKSLKFTQKWTCKKICVPLKLHARYLSCSHGKFSEKKPPIDTIIASVHKDEQSKKKESKTIVDAMKKYILMRRNYNEKYTGNNLITKHRAMQEFLLKPDDFKDLKFEKIRNPYSWDKTPIYVYLERDVHKKAIEKFGSDDRLKKMQEKLKLFQEREHHRLHDIFVVDESFGQSKPLKKKTIFTSGAGRVVAVAVATNTILFIFKLTCWWSTGCASMFSESIHSLADTANQVLLLWGVHESTKTPDKRHPYGFGNMRYITSLISGVGIFCLGSGATIYHGIEGMLHCNAVVGPPPIYSLMVLGGAALLESVSLWIAVRETRRNAILKGTTLWNYIKSSHDPSTNVVLLEDTCAVLGVGIASVAIVLTHYLSNPLYDYIGSVGIGSLLGVVAAFLVSSNANILLGKSIPDPKLETLKEALEDDAVIRGVYDIKATQVGMGEFKFKAEIDFDGREVTREYLNLCNFDDLIDQFHGIKSEEDLENFLLHHGEQIIDALGTQVDRLEHDLKKLNPELKHIDLEIL